MLQGNPEPGPSIMNAHVDTLDETANVQYAMNTTDWDVLFDSERFQEIDDEGNIIPNRDSIESDLEMDQENPLHDAYASQSEGTLMDEVIRTFSSPRFTIQESSLADPSSSDISHPSSSVEALTRSNRPGLALLRLATLPRTLTTHLLSTPTYSHPDRHVHSHPHPHPHPSPHPNETLYRYQKLFIQALSQAASAKARHPRKPKENIVGQGSGIGGKRRPAKPGGPRSDRVKGSRKSMPMSAAVKTKLQMDVDEYRKECHGVYSRGVFGQGSSSGDGDGDGQGIGMTGTKWDEEMEDSGDGLPSMMDGEDTGFGMQVEALSDRLSGAFISNC